MATVITSAKEGSGVVGNTDLYQLPLAKGLGSISGVEMGVKMELFFCCPEAPQSQLL